MRKEFLTAEWKHLVMASYAVDPSLLTGYLPRKTELDMYNGNAYVSLVGFLFANTRLLGYKVPFHVNFEEVNLRFYVRYNDAGSWKRGTVFIKEIVPRRAISLVANTLYRENYHTMPMRHFYNISDNQVTLGYHWKFRNRWNRLEATTGKVPEPMRAGSEEEFIAEHYWGYSKYNDNTTFEYAVQHPPWKIFTVKEFLIDCDFTGLYGRHFSVLQTEQPKSVFVAEGSAVSVLHKKNL